MYYFYFMYKTCKNNIFGFAVFNEKQSSADLHEICMYMKYGKNTVIVLLFNIYIRLIVINVICVIDAFGVRHLDVTL